MVTPPSKIGPRGRQKRRERRASADGCAEQPPKRRAATAATRGRPSRLAKENNLSAEEESEIKEAWSLFAETVDGERDGVLPIQDLKSALM